jgi:hypothetical protein
MAMRKLDKFEIPVLDADNYTLWKNKMKMYLTLKGLWEVVEQHDDKAAKDAAKARAIIGLNVSDAHVTVVANCATAHEAWTTLEKIFEPQIAGRAIKLQRDLVAIRMEANETVEVYMG